ncbi:SDR family oxidoreductase [Streptomyces sp. NPDC047002]|uniref:SDR family oxidoreductase n=1 Tax=Streptomyces sp. NPDC047002 TaxID=3155475 RepID=UPI003451D3A1
MSVALTGATGFLGLRILRRLLDEHPSLTLLARREPGSVFRRIERFLELSGEPDELAAQLPRRLRVVQTDLERPRMGLPKSAFQELADGLDTIWHSAGDTSLQSALPALRRINVDGTRRVLELAAAGRGRPVVHHVSTAFVAGRRREGVAYEDELDDTAGFENAYERSKYEAEVLVRAWSREHGRPVVVLRPSILVSNLPPHPDLPCQPLQHVERVVRETLRATGRARAQGTAAGRPVVRLVGRAQGHLNMMPVEEAASVMARLASRAPSGGADTYNVVHEHDVPVSAVTALLGHLGGLTARLVEERPPTVSALEAALDLYPGFTCYLRHRRRFDDTRVRTVIGAPRSATRVDVGYLLSGLRPRHGGTG